MKNWVSDSPELPVALIITEPPGWALDAKVTLKLPSPPAVGLIISTSVPKLIRTSLLAVKPVPLMAIFSPTKPIGKPVPVVALVGGSSSGSIKNVLPVCSLPEIE